MRRTFTEDQDQEIAHEYDAGATFREIAARWGTSDIVVRNAALRGGATPRTTAQSSRRKRPVLVDADAAEMKRNGSTVRAIARHYGVRTEAASAALERAGIDLGARRSHPSIPPARWPDVVAAYEELASLQATANRFGVSVPTIGSVLDRAGARRNEHGRPVTWTEERAAELISSYRAGATFRELATQFGLSATGVRKRLITLGEHIPLQHVRGPECRSWRGGRVGLAKGYVGVRPTADDLQFVTPNSGGYVAEHRLVMARALGRALTEDETVHHINGDRADNSPENLQLRTGRHGSGVVHQCLDCGSINVAAVELADLSS